jgi:hypothetical protein
LEGFLLVPGPKDLAVNGGLWAEDTACGYCRFDFGCRGEPFECRANFPMFGYVGRKIDCNTFEVGSEYNCVAVE